MTTQEAILAARAQALAMQQALLFLFLGAAIVFSGGRILHGSLYGPLVDGECMLLGFAHLIFGASYFFVIYRNIHEARRWYALAATLVWFGFTGFYAGSGLHKIGAITCMVLALSQMYEQYCRTKLQEMIIGRFEKYAYWRLTRKIENIERLMYGAPSRRFKYVPYPPISTHNGRLTLPHTWTLEETGFTSWLTHTPSRSS